MLGIPGIVVFALVLVFPSQVDTAARPPPFYHDPHMRSYQQDTASSFYRAVETSREGAQRDARNLHRLLDIHLATPDWTNLDRRPMFTGAQRRVAEQRNGRRPVPAVLYNRTPLRQRPRAQRQQQQVQQVQQEQRNQQGDQDEVEQARAGDSLESIANRAGAQPELREAGEQAVMDGGDGEREEEDPIEAVDSLIRTLLARILTPEAAAEHRSEMLDLLRRRASLTFGRHFEGSQQNGLNIGHWIRSETVSSDALMVIQSGELEGLEECLVTRVGNGICSVAMRMGTVSGAYLAVSRGIQRFPGIGFTFTSAGANFDLNREQFASIEIQYTDPGMGVFMDEVLRLLGAADTFPTGPSSIFSYFSDSHHARRAAYILHSASMDGIVLVVSTLTVPVPP